MFVVVGDEVVERETIVTRHEVDTLLRLALLVPVDLGAADNAVRDAAQRSGFAAEEIAEIVAKAAVPLLPGIADEAADLVEPGGVPGLGEQLRARERWIGFDVPEHRWVRLRPSGLIARQD